MSAEIQAAREKQDAAARQRQYERDRARLEAQRATEVCCTRCRQMKPGTDFYRKGTRRFQSWCKACFSEVNHAKTAHPEAPTRARRSCIDHSAPTAFCTVCGETKDGGRFCRYADGRYQSVCKDCSNIRRREIREERADEARQRAENEEAFRQRDEEELARLEAEAANDPEVQRRRADLANSLEDQAVQVLKCRRPEVLTKSRASAEKAPLPAPTLAHLEKLPKSEAEIKTRNVVTRVGSRSEPKAPASLPEPEPLPEESPLEKAWRSRKPRAHLADVVRVYLDEWGDEESRWRWIYSVRIEEETEAVA